MSDTKEYNGHESWDFWNVSLWINNDEPTYQRALRLCKHYGYAKTAKIMCHTRRGESTPDGAKYTYSNIRRALQGMLD